MSNLQPKFRTSLRQWYRRCSRRIDKMLPNRLCTKCYEWFRCSFHPNPVRKCNRQRTVPMVYRPRQHCTAQPDWPQHGWLPFARNCPMDDTLESIRKLDVDATFQWSTGWCYQSCNCKWWNPRMWTMARQHDFANAGIQSPIFHGACHRWPTLTMAMARLPKIDRNRFLANAILNLKIKKNRKFVKLPFEKCVKKRFG